MSSGNDTAHTTDYDKVEGARGRGSTSFEEDTLYRAMREREKGVTVGHDGSKARLVERINGGSYGDIYLGSLVDKPDTRVAVKVERQKSSSSEQLLYEGNVYRNLEGGPGIPRVHWFGMHGSSHNVLVMDLLGHSLQELFTKCKRAFSLKTVLQLIDAMVEIIENIHNQGYVHRDISPNNFIFGTGEQCNKLFLIDFGHARKFSTGPMNFSSTRRNRIHIARKLVGTPRYASVHAHLGHPESRRDDLEAIGYVWIYFLRGIMPWQGIKCDSMDDKLTQIGNMKMSLPIETLCEGLPGEFALYMNYVRQLGQYAIPDYATIRQIFRNLATNNGHCYDSVFDWSSRTISESSTDSDEVFRRDSSEESTISPVSH